MNRKRTQAGLKLNDHDAQLYNTIIAVREPLALAHGGWVTQSTCKAINTALMQWGYDTRVNRAKGSMLVRDSKGGLLGVVGDELQLIQL